MPRTQPTTKEANISSTTHVQMLQWLQCKQQHNIRYSLDCVIPFSELTQYLTAKHTVFLENHIKTSFCPALFNYYQIFKSVTKDGKKLNWIINNLDEAFALLPFLSLPRWLGRPPGWTSRTWSGTSCLNQQDYYTLLYSLPKLSKCLII